MAFEMQKDKTPPGKPTQAFLRISEIKDDTLVLDDGTLRAILAVSSTNFDLKNEEEQNALIYSYQRFINSLDFPVQILMQSRRMEVGEYLAKLKDMAVKQTNELLRMQTTEYISFIAQLVENANITNKNFYIIVPYGGSIFPNSGGGIFSKLFGKSGGAANLQAKLENFSKYKTLLDDRVTSVTSNLSSAGLRVMRLHSEEIVELLYNSYNFDAGPLIDASKLKDIKLNS